MTSCPWEFDEERKAGVYDAIFKRRDMRHFISDPVEEEILDRLLQAAHAAPSVGLMQPWRIVRIKQQGRRQQLHRLVEEERVSTAHAMGQRKEEFMALEVQGILDCAEVWAVALMDARERHVFGRRTLPQMDLASVACAIQNIWLAARAEGIGVGWVSIFDPEQLKALLQMPASSEPVALLCIGRVESFYDEPMLATEGWARRGEMEDYVMEESWDEEKASRAQRQWNSTRPT